MPGKETTTRVSKRALSKSGLETNEPLESDGSFFTPRSQFGLLSTVGHRITLESCYFPDESSDQDLLLDLPSNGSFPEAELLLPTSSFASHQTSASCSYSHPGMINR